MTNMINNIGDRMVTKARVVNEFMKSWVAGNEKGNMRENPFYSEFMGMCQLLKAMEIEFDLEHDLTTEALEIKTIVIMGKRFEV